MKRHESREKAMIVIYQYLLFPRDINELIENNFEDQDKQDSYILDVIHSSIENKERYEGYINQVLKDWSFSRLGYIEQAILLNGCSEFDLKQTESAVIIDESIIMAKKYCEPESYKLINGVLDTL